MMANNVNDSCSFGLDFRRHCVRAFPAGVLMAILGAIVVVSSVVPEFEATHILQASSDFVLSSDLVGVPKDLAKNELPLIMSPEVMDEVLAD